MRNNKEIVILEMNLLRGIDCIIFANVIIFYKKL